MRRLISFILLACMANVAGCSKPKSIAHKIDVHPEFFGDGEFLCSGVKLIDSGFSGVLDQLVSIEYIGKIKADSISYSIYYYYREGNHGTHRIIILEDGCGYFGSYSVNERPLRVSGSDIVFDAPKNLGNVIHFSGISPPVRVIIDGEMTDFWR